MSESFVLNEGIAIVNVLGMIFYMSRWICPCESQRVFTIQILSTYQPLSLFLLGCGLELLTHNIEPKYCCIVLH